MDHNRQSNLHRAVATRRRKIGGGTERRRDGETEGRRDGGTERRRDGETEGRRDGGTERRLVSLSLCLSVSLSLRLSLPLFLCPGMSAAGDEQIGHRDQQYYRW